MMTPKDYFWKAIAIISIMAVVLIIAKSELNEAKREYDRKFEQCDQRMDSIQRRIDLWNEHYARCMFLDKSNIEFDSRGYLKLKKPGLIKY